MEELHCTTLGHIIADSTVPQLLYDSKVIGWGSRNGFLAGKHYNWCSRIHPILLATLSKIHLKQYIQETQPDGIPQNVLDELATVHTDPSQVERKLKEENSVIVNFDHYTVWGLYKSYEMWRSWKNRSIHDYEHGLCKVLPAVGEGIKDKWCWVIHLCSQDAPTCLLGNQPSQL